MSRVSKNDIFNEVMVSIADNSQLINDCLEGRTNFSEIVELIANLSKPNREEACEVINDNPVDHDSLMYIWIVQKSYPKLSDLNIARAIKLATLNDGVKVKEIVKKFLSLALSGNDDKGILDLFNFTYSLKIPIFVAEILFEKHKRKGKQFHYVDYHEWQRDPETNEEYKAPKKGLYTFIDDICFAITLSRDKLMGDYAIKEEINKIGLLEFVYGKSYGDNYPYELE